MSQADRRKFLAVTGAGAAAGAVGAVGLAGPASASVRGDAATDAVVVLVEDHRGDTLTMMVGEREVEVRDRDLVVRIMNAAGGR